VRARECVRVCVYLAIKYIQDVLYAKTISELKKALTNDKSLNI
jgi:hypothetical protein